VAIDAKRYELKTLDDLSLPDFKRLQLAAPLLTDLGAQSDSDPTQLVVAEELIADLVRAVLLAPEPVQKRLSVNHRLSILVAFMNNIPIAQLAQSFGRVAGRPRVRKQR
jgi:hypothetical protein